MRKKYTVTKPAAMIILFAAFIMIFTGRPAYSDDSVIEWDHVPKSGGYVVVIKGENDRVLVRSRTKDNFFKLNLPPGKYYFRLSVLNILGVEEAMSDWKEFQIKLVSRKPVAYNFVITPSYYYPTGVLAKLIKPGFGTQLSIGFENLLFDNFETGLSAGLFYLPGKEEREIKHILLSPVRVYTGYHFNINEKFSVFPYVGAGMNYSQNTYTNKEYFSSNRVINPAASAGLSLIFKSGVLIFPIGGGASVMYENEGFIYDYTAHAGIGFHF
jgi:hypothetical protein